MHLLKGGSWTAGVVALWLAAGSINGYGANVSFTGTFAQDADTRFFQLNLASPSTVTLLTYSYGGGINSAGSTIARGGFEPVLGLFSGLGTLLRTSEPNGTCPPQTADSVTGLCVDAYIQQNLSAGVYFASLTEFFNVPVGPMLSNGFLQAGTGNFTGPTCSVTNGSFLDETCNQRANRFALDILGVTSATAISGTPTAIPEPSTLGLIALPLVYYAARLRKRRLHVGESNK